MERIRIKKPKTRNWNAEWERAGADGGDAALADARRAAVRSRALQERIQNLLEELEMLLYEIA